MKLVTLPAHSVLIGQPLPFSIRDVEGFLLAKKGAVFQSREELKTLAANRAHLYIDVVESELHHRAYIGRLHALISDDTQLGQIAGAMVSTDDRSPERAGPHDAPTDWLDLQAQANTVLRDASAPHFLKRLEQLQQQLEHLARRNPDGLLLALFQLSASELKLYSATHAMLVSVICGIAVRDVLHWSTALEHSVCQAALTMNISMTDLQDRLALQLEPPAAEQRLQIDRHAERSVMLLDHAGVHDAVWLEAIQAHHHVAPGALTKKTEGLRLARLIQRADMFAARLAPRATRLPSSSAAAMQASYFDENRQVDEAGAALIKAVGIYTPGSFVRLATKEIAVVVRRGRNTTTPRVAVIINREGMPTVEPMVRDTVQREYAIVASVAHRDVRVKLNVPRLLALCRPG
jgi:HD-GYP domain-containing protein (c-di-GMP phosphodiesterase class II)